MRGWVIAVIASSLAFFAAPLPAHALEWHQVRLQAKSLDAAGTTFAYAAVGEGPVLLLLNGTASPMSEWDPAFLGALSDHYRLIVFDYPGLGGSGPPPDTWTFDNAAQWVSDFIAVLSPGEPVNVLGWSMGGFIAQRLAARHPEQVRRLVLASTNPGGSGTVLGPPWVQEADSGGDIEAYLRSNYPPGSRADGRSFIKRLNAATKVGAYPVSPVPPRTLRAMVEAEDPWIKSDANASSLAGITIPTLVITGARDVVTPPVNSRRIASAIPRSRLILISNSGHSFLFQKPYRAARIITTFLGDGNGG